MTKYYEECHHCDGLGYVLVPCCSGMEDGVMVCDCRGRGVDEDCAFCNGTGKVECDTITWDYSSMCEEERHEHEVHYIIYGKGSNGSYIATAIYTGGSYVDIVDIEPIDEEK